MNIFLHKNMIKPPLLPVSLTQSDKFFHPVVLYGNYLICIIMNINENFGNETKILERLRDVHLKLPMFYLPCVLCITHSYKSHNGLPWKP